MPLPSSQKYRTVLACVIAASAAVATAVAFAWPNKGVAAQATPGLYCYEADGFRYEYHAPTGHEGLYDLRTDPNTVVDVLQGHADVAARCRRNLAEKLHVKSLESLRGEYDDTIRRLKALGYL
jgi:hypothetical protein